MFPFVYNMYEKASMYIIEDRGEIFGCRAQLEVSVQYQPQQEAGNNPCMYISVKLDSVVDV